MLFGEETRVVLELLEVLDIAWHDCSGDVSPPEQVIADVLVCSRGRLAELIHAVHLAVTDWRDLRVAADALRDEASGIG